MPPSSPASLRHRRSFWIGLGTLILLTAAWVQSIGQQTSFTRVGPEYYFSVTHSGGFFALTFGTRTSGSAPPKIIITEWQFNNPLDSDSAGLEFPRVYQESFGPWSAIIPYWFIITLFLIGWASILIWRTHTIRKHLNQIAHLTNP